MVKSLLKKVFSPDIGVETSFHILDIRMYACGVPLCFALISNENPIFEVAFGRKETVNAARRGIR